MINGEGLNIMKKAPYHIVKQNFLVCSLGIAVCKSLGTVSELKDKGLAIVNLFMLTYKLSSLYTSIRSSRSFSISLADTRGGDNINYDML